jgi:hypothetical protein
LGIIDAGTTERARPSSYIQYDSRGGNYTGKLQPHSGISASSPRRRSKTRDLSGATAEDVDRHYHPHRLGDLRDARVVIVDDPRASRRPHYLPAVRLEILELRAPRGWSCKAGTPAASMAYTLRNSAETFPPRRATRTTLAFFAAFRSCRHSSGECGRVTEYPSIDSGRAGKPGGEGILLNWSPRSHW